MNAFAKSILIAGLALVTSTAAYADRYRGGMRDRLEYNQSLIERGTESGDLTEREARRLWREHREIRDLNDELRDSDMSRDDRHRIISERLDREEEHIQRLIDNDHTRYNEDRRREDRRDEWPPLPPGFRRDL